MTAREAKTCLYLRIVVDDMRVILHALGLDRSATAYRNYYSTPDPSRFDKLVQLGLMRENQTNAELPGATTFHVTVAAIEKLKALGWAAEVFS